MNIENENKQIVKKVEIDNGLYNFFVDSFSKAFSNLNLPYIYYQTNAVVAYVQGVGTSMISVYNGETKIVEFFFDKSNALLTVTLLTPTLLVLGVTLIYAIVNTASKYGIEKVKVFVNESSLALIINVRDNTEDVLKKIVIFMNRVQEEISKKIINLGIIIFSLYFVYKQVF